jgi:plasmid segregation protein ParM
MQSNRKMVVRAIDGGYGRFKLVEGRTQSEIRCEMFPSLAPLVTTDARDDEFLTKRNTVRVVVNGNTYEVGQDVVLAQGGYVNGRLLSEEYSLSDQYRALMYGALKIMNKKEIDVLVLGLPLNTHRAYKDKLAAAYTGRFDLDGTRTVQINKVLVVPQPVGALYDYAISTKQLASMRGETTLVIDPGYLTLDWLVTKDLKVNEVRSGALPHAGMANVLRDIAEAIARDIGRSVDELGSIERIDTALRLGQPLKLFGEVRDIQGYIKIGQRRIADPVQQMLESVTSLGDIDNVILSGGGSFIYAEVLRTLLKRSNVIEIADPAYANVRGFQLVGEMWLKQQQGQA